MSARPVQGNMAPPQPCYTSVPPRVVSDSSSSNMSMSAPFFFESNSNNNFNSSKDAVEKYEVLSDISTDDHQHIFMEEDEQESPVVVLSRTQVVGVGVGGNNCNNRSRSFSANNADEVFSLSFALPPKEKSSASSACMSVDEVLPADPPLQAKNHHHHHHALPSSNEQQLEVLVHPVTPTYERKKHLFQDQHQHQHQHQCCEHNEDHTKCVFRCCHGSSAAPAQCPAQVPLPSFGSSASCTRNHFDDHRRNCSDKDQAIYETKTTDFPMAPRVSRTTSYSNVRRMSKSSRSRIREDYYYSSSNSHASTSIPRCVYVTSDVGSHHHGPASRHRRAMSSSTVSISTMENIDDEGWDANKRRMFFDQQRREQAKSVVAQEIRYYVGQLSPFPKRKLNRNVELKRCNGCLA